MELAEHPRSRPGVAAGLLVAVGVALVIRVVFGTVLGDPIHPVTYWGLVGGAMGSLTMVAIKRRYSTDPLATIVFWATYLGDGDPTGYYRQGTWLHITYFTIAAGFYARFWRKVVWVGGWVFAALPSSLATGVGFGAVVFVPSLTYVLTGVWEVDIEPFPLFRFFGLHLAYGLTLGLVAGLWRPVFGPLFGAV